ncbi:transposase [Streptomyces sp. NPDC055059]
MRDRLDELFVDEDFADWYPSDGRPGLSPARLALVSVLQYTENLTDRQAAEAVRCRLDWKYCLGLELDDAGFDFSVLSEFRDRLAEGDRADRLLAVMVERLAAAGLVKRRGRVRTDSTHVLAAVRRLNRGELVAETLRAALEELVAHGEEWLAGLVTADWGDRYGRPVRYDRLPRGGDALIAYVLRVGEDGMHILRAVHDSDAPPGLRVLPAVEILRQVWVQQYWVDWDGQLRWRGPKSSRDRASRRTTERRNTGKASADGPPDPASARVPWSGMEIVTPHDPEAEGFQFNHLQRTPTITGVLPGQGWKIRYFESGNEGPVPHVEPVVAWHVLSDGSTLPLDAPRQGDDGDWTAANWVGGRLIHPDGTEDDGGGYLAAFMDWYGACASSARRYRRVDGTEMQCPDCHIDHPADSGRQQELAADRAKTQS